jgi:hypothetical protein
MQLPHLQLTVPPLSVTLKRPDTDAADLSPFVLV